VRQFMQQNTPFFRLLSNYSAMSRARLVLLLLIAAAAAQNDCDKDGICPAAAQDQCNDDSCAANPQRDRVGRSEIEAGDEADEIAMLQSRVSMEGEAFAPDEATDADDTDGDDAGEPATEEQLKEHHDLGTLDDSHFILCGVGGLETHVEEYGHAIDDAEDDDDSNDDDAGKNAEEEMMQEDASDDEQNEGMASNSSVEEKRILLSKRTSDEEDEVDGQSLLAHDSTEKQEDGEDQDLEGRGGKGRRSFKKVRKTVKKAGRSARRARNSAKKSVRKAAKATRKNAVPAIKKFGRAATRVTNTINRNLGRMVDAAAAMAKDVYNALSSVVDFGCFNPTTLFSKLMFPSQYFNEDCSKVNLNLKGNPTLSAKSCPKVDGLRLRTQKYSRYGFTAQGGADVDFAPIIHLEADPVKMKYKVKFSGSVHVRVFADVVAERTYNYKRVEKFPKQPKIVTKCVPAFCVSLLLQGLATLEIQAKAQGSIAAEVKGSFSVAAEATIDLKTGRTEANVNSGKLTHSEKLTYQNDYSGSMKLTAGPVFTILPTPGTPISLVPAVSAHVQAYAEANAWPPCGAAVINVDASAGIEALGLPAGINFDPKAITDDIKSEIQQLPLRMKTQLANMMGSCIRIPGAKAAQRAMEKAVSEMSKVLDRAVPNVKLTFGNPDKLLNPSICFNVLKLTVPSNAASCRAVCNTMSCR